MAAEERDVEPGEPFVEVEKEQITNGTVIGPYYEGSTLLLQCKLPGGRPVPGIHWWNSTTPMATKLNVKTNEDWTYDVTSTTRFVLSRYDLGAKFECVIENNVTRTFHNMWLKIDIFVRPRSITLRGPTTEVVAGEMVSLTCAVDGARPPANVTWYNRTDVIRPQPPSSKDLMSEGTYRTSSTLVFVASQHDHAREFFCKGTNEVLQRRQEAPLLQAVRLEVLYPPSVLIQPYGILTILEHEATNITCSYDANPPNITEIIWYKDDQSLPRLRKGPTSAPPGRRPVMKKMLAFRNVTRQDAGTYSCHVRNAFGRANSSNILQVNVVYPPEVAVRISPDTITEGQDQSARILCSALHGNPPRLEEVKWFFNGEPLNLTSLAGPDIQLNGVQRQLSGQYSCQGRSAAGWSDPSKSEHLTVYYPPGSASVSQREKMAVKGKPVTLECQLEEKGFPAASLYRWERDGETINCSGQVCVTGTAGLVTQGNYSCAAINNVGPGLPAAVYLKVQAPPTLLHQLPPVSGALRNASRVDLVCHVECDPLCDVYWMRNNEPLKDLPSFVQRSQRLETQKSFLSITSSLSWNMAQVSALELDNSTFSCHSTGNDAGPGVQSVTIFRVEYPPENIRIPALEILLTEGETAEELMCTAAAHPLGDYVWTTGEKIVSRTPHLFSNSSVDRAMGGRYSCVVTNRHGHTQAELKITVLHKPDCFLKKEYDQQGNAVLSCSATGVPAIFNFTWHRNNVTLEETTVLGYESVSRYVVLHSEEGNYGRYSCVVSNSIGTSDVCALQIFSLPAQSGWVQLLLQEESMIIVACVVGGVAVSGILIIVTFLAILTRKRMRSVNSCNMGERQNPEGRDPSPEHALNGKSQGPITEKRDWTPLLKDEETGWTKDDLNNHHHSVDCRTIVYKDYKMCNHDAR